MSTKVKPTQNVTGTLRQLLDYLPDRVDGVSSDTKQYGIRINGVLRLLGQLGFDTPFMFRNVVELEAFKPDLNDIQQNDQAILFGNAAAGDEGVRMMKWDATATGETDFAAGVVKPSYDKDNHAWTANGRWVLDFALKALIDNADGIILGVDDGDRVSFNNALAHRGRRLSDHYVVEAENFEFPPAAPSLGEAYLLGPVLPIDEGDWGGEWAGMPVNSLVWYAGQDAQNDPIWINETPRDGATILNKRLAAFYEWNAAATQWLYILARNNDRHKLQNTLTRPDIVGKTRLQGPDDGHNLEGFVNFPAGAVLKLYPGSVDFQLLHNVDVSTTAGAVPFETPDGEPYDVLASSNTPIFLERDVDLNVIRVIGGGVTSKALTDGIAAETAARTAADAALQTSIDAEATARTAADTALQAELDAHEAANDNPHAVTKAQVGLDQADNTSDTDKPISTAQQAALDLKAPLANPNFSGDPQKGGVNLATVDDVSAVVDGLDWQDSVLDKDLTAPPGGETTGDRYIVAAAGGTATSAWSLRELEIAEWNGSGWDFTTPNDGFASFVEDEGAGYVFNAGAWVKRDANDPNISRLDRNETVAGDKNHTGALQKDGVDVATAADIDGAVFGPASATNEHVAVFDQTTGKLIKDGGVSLAALAISATLASAAVGQGAALIGYAVDGTGAAETTVTEKFAERVSVKDFAAVGDNATDDTAAIQAAEDYCESLGRDIELWFPHGTYAIDDSIVKKTRVHWRGKGKLRRIDNAAPVRGQYPLVDARETDGWTIIGPSFEGVAHDIVMSTPVERGRSDIDVDAGPAPGNWNSCIDAYKSQDWSVENCKFEKFSQAIQVTGAGNYRIRKNRIKSGITGYTVADVLAGTPHSWSKAGSGGIVYLYDATLSVAPVALGGEISGNWISVPGLDIGIAPTLNSFTQHDVLIVSNRVRGAHSGIQIYNGSAIDPGTTTTYNNGSLIADNTVYATWEQGIYVRGTIGVSVLGNKVDRAAQLDSGSDSSYGGIICRVNPFAPAVSATFTSASSLSDEYGTLISSNVVTNTGRQGASQFTGAIYARQNNISVLNNVISNPSENFSSAYGYGIVVALGGILKNFDVRDNKVYGHFDYGVIVSDNFKDADFDSDFGIIQRNEIHLTGATYGIYVNWYSFNVRVDDNGISGATTNIYVRRSPYSTVSRNRMAGGTNGIQVSNFNLASDAPLFASNNTETNANRRGGTLDIFENEYTGVITPHALQSTNGDDASFHGRTRKFYGEVIDGQLYEEAYSGGAPSSTFTARSWHIHETTKNSSIAAGATPGKVCFAPGTYGSSATTTGNTTSGSAVISNIADFDGYGPGIYLNPSAGFSGVVRIVAIDTSANTITVSENATSTETGVTLTPATPAFVDPYGADAPNIDVPASVSVNGTQVIGAQVVDADIANPNAISAYSAADISATYVEAEVQTIADALATLRTEVADLQLKLTAANNALRTHGLAVET